MILAASVAFALCLLLSVGQCVVVGAFLWVCRRNQKPRRDDFQPLKAAVVLSLRGPDPFLGNCLRGLIRQQYDDFTIFLVVDHQDDPVIDDIKKVIDETDADNVVVSILRDHRSTCSLKCSAMIQGVTDLDDSYQVVAFVDGDALPHETWLMELVDPLHNDKVGVTYGNRWYAPPDRGVGSWVRYCWNVGAVVQVWLNDIVWAGSMALRLDTISKIDLLESWSKAISDDSMVHRQLRKHQYKIKFVPSVIMVNREAIGCGNFMNWMQRQLVASKSCGAGWLWVGLHGVNLAATQVFTIAILIGALYSADATSTWLGLSGLAIYWGSSLASILLTERQMRRTTRELGQPISWPPFAGTLMILPAMLIIQCAYPIVLASAFLKRRIVWRGIEYDILGVGNVVMRNYHPYRENATAQTESVV